MYRRATGHWVEAWAARATSTTCSTCEVVAMTTMTGPTAALWAGDTRMFSLTSLSQRTNATESSFARVYQPHILNSTYACHSRILKTNKKPKVIWQKPHRTFLSLGKQNPRLVQCALDPRDSLLWTELQLLQPLLHSTLSTAVLYRHTDTPWGPPTRTSVGRVSAIVRDSCIDAILKVNEYFV